MLALTNWFYANSFTLGQFFQHSKTAGKQWGLDIIAVVGIVCLVFAAIEVVKGLKARDGGASHWIKFIVGAILGGMLTWRAKTGFGEFNSDSTFKDLTGNNDNGQTIMNMFSSLPFHDFIQML